MSTLTCGRTATVKGHFVICTMTSDHADEAHYDSITHRRWLEVLEDTR